MLTYPILEMFSIDPALQPNGFNMFQHQTQNESSQATKSRVMFSNDPKRQKLTSFVRLVLTHIIPYLRSTFQKIVYVGGQRGKTIPK
jgi:hypothetical protein